MGLYDDLLYTRWLETLYVKQTFTANVLNTVEIANPSSTVFKYVGAYGVEPAARLFSGELTNGWLKR